jgi:hypothetical protein
MLSVLKSLEGDPEGKIIVQCHSCRGARFVQIGYKGGALYFKAVDAKPDLGEVVTFSNKKTCSEVGLIKEEIDVEQEK